MDTESQTAAVARFSRWTGIGKIGLAMVFVGMNPAMGEAESASENKKPVQLEAFEISEDVPPLVRVGEYRLAMPRYGLAAVASDKHIYSIGGGDGSAIHGDVQRFDPKTGQTEVLSHYVIKRRYHNAARVGDKIYIVGGSSGLLEALEVPDVEIFDPKTGKITFGRKHPHPALNAGMAVHDGKIYLFGGTLLHGAARFVTNRVMIYDPVKDRWSEGAPMPTARECAAASVGSFVVVSGGYADLKKISAVEAYSPATDSWKALPPLSRPMSATSVVFFDHYLFHFSDHDDTHVVLAYDLKSKLSREIAVPFTPRRWAKAVVLNDSIYVLGGASGLVKEKPTHTRAGNVQTSGPYPVEAIEVFQVPPGLDKTSKPAQQGAKTIPVSALKS